MLVLLPCRLLSEITAPNISRAEAPDEQDNQSIVMEANARRSSNFAQSRSAIPQNCAVVDLAAGSEAYVTGSCAVLMQLTRPCLHYYHPVWGYDCIDVLFTAS